jgi:hypothetical protein
MYYRSDRSFQHSDWVVAKPEITQFFERVGLAGICSSMRAARAIGEQGEVKGISRGQRDQGRQPFWGVDSVVPVEGFGRKS